MKLDATYCDGGIESISNLNNSILIFEKIEKKVVVLEKTIGYERMLSSGPSLTNGTLYDYVDTYKNYISSNEWPNVKKESDLATFILEYEASLCAGIDLAFKIIGNSSDGNTDSRNWDFDIAAAEALRGQYGKRSPTGLDARRDMLVESLEGLISTLDEIDGNDLINTLCSPLLRGLDAAEHIMCQDILDLFSIFSTPPQLSSIQLLNAFELEVFARVMRRHAHWDFNKLQELFDGFDINRALILIEMREYHKKEYQKRAQQYFFYMDSKLSPVEKKIVVGLTNEIAALMFLDLSVEPFFSFKGYVGRVLMYALNTFDVTFIPIEKLNEAKWKLLKKSYKLCKN